VSSQLILQDCCSWEIQNWNFISCSLLVISSNPPTIQSSWVSSKIFCSPVCLLFFKGYWNFCQMFVNASISYRVLSSRNCLELDNKWSPFHWMLLKLMEVQVMYIEAVILCSSMLCFHAVEQDSEHDSFFCFLSLWVGFPLVWDCWYADRFQMSINALSQHLLTLFVMTMIGSIEKFFTLLMI